MILEMDEETYRLVSKPLSELTVVGQLVKLDGAVMAVGIMELDGPGGGLALDGRAGYFKLYSGGRYVCHSSAREAERERRQKKEVLT